MSCEKCKKCGEYSFDVANCHCVDFVVVFDGEESTVCANHEAAAAEKYGREYNDNGDYRLMDNPIEVEVKGPDGSKFFRVSAEQSIDYSCEEISKPGES